MHQSKGQSLIFEQVILFSIGVVIFIMCFAVFNIYQTYFSSVGINDQLDQLRSWVSSNILKLAENTEANSSIILEIPRRLAGEEYEIELNDDGIRVMSYMTMTEKQTPLFNLSSQYRLSGKVVSSGSRFIIYKRGNEIIIS
jgi:hypothetical protein